MTDPQGKFVWYELMTSDPAQAEVFYKALLGWTAEPVGTTLEGTPYIRFGAAGEPVGGLMQLPQRAAEGGMRPGWIGYIWVRDVDAATGKVEAAGGAVLRAPGEIPHVGRFSVVADPHGAPFVLFKHSGLETRPPVPPNAPGHVGWHELHAGNGEAALAFYSGQFGWSKAETFDMGPQLGAYQLFVTGEGATPGPLEQMGGIMTKMEHTPVPFWLFYFNVGNIDEAAARVTAGGGKILNGPHQVPGGTWVLQCFDPQGAMFALAGSRP